MEKVFVVHVRQIDDMAIIRDDVTIYRSLETARADLKAFVKDERKFVEEEGWRISQDNDMEFEAFEDGYYNNNSTNIWITEEVIRKEKKKLR